MGLTNLSGPLVVAGTEPDISPSFFYGGSAMLMDPRVGYLIGGAPGSPPVLGWGGADYLTTKQIPSALATNNIVNASPGVANTPLTLVSSSGAGITVGVALTNALTGARVTVLAIDLPMFGNYLAFGYTPASVQCYDPRRSIARALRIVSSGAGDTTQTITTRGFDLYNYPMSETLSLNGTTSVAGKKAFKYILSCTPSANTAGNISVGTSDIYGMPLFVPQAPAMPPGVGGISMLEVFWANAF